MSSNFHELNYEDFCTDVSNFLKEHEKDLIEYSVSHLANTMKSDATPELLLKFADAIHRKLRLP